MVLYRKNQNSGRYISYNYASSSPKNIAYKLELSYSNCDAEMERLSKKLDKDIDIVDIKQEVTLISKNYISCCVTYLYAIID